tara:strand:- start:981 stop:2024 length:1044 start_codon:yes stop_codon:yes gene_type:complete
MVASKQKKFSRELLLILFFPFLVSIFTSFIGLVFQNQTTFSFFLSLQTLIHHLVYIVLIVFVVTNFNKNFSIRIFQFPFFVLSLFSFLQIIQYQLGLDVFHLKSTHPSFAGYMGGIFGADYSGATFRISGLFEEPGDLTMFIAPLILLISYHKNFINSTFFFITIFLIFVFSRGLAGILALAGTLIIYNLNKILRLRYLFLIVVTLIITVTTYSDRLFFILSGNDPSFNVRFLTITTGLQYLYSDGSLLFFGNGLGSASDIDLNTGDTSIKSDYIRILFENGIFGLSLYLGYIGYILSKYRNNMIFQLVFIYFLILGILSDTLPLMYSYIFLSIAFFSQAHPSQQSL